MNSQKINQVLTEALAAWRIPGAAVAILTGSEPFTQGYGVLAAGQLAAVNADTIFAIGSTTKPFTSALVGMLVDEGKLGWDDPVATHLPGFALADPWVTQNVTIRDLLCHRLGLERAQRLYYHQGYDQGEIMRRMRHLRPESGFRTQFHYANQQFGVAGLIVEAKSGMSWDDFISDRVFKPLKMSRSFSGFDRLGDSSNLALPHASLDETYPAGVRFLGEKQVLPWYKLSHEPAGSIHTTANDLIQWLKVLLDGGTPLLKPNTFSEIISPQMVMQDLENSELAPLYYLQPGTHFWTYGLGWWVMDYRGEKVLMHGGQMPGFNSVVAFYPERKIGFAVMVNVHQTLAHAALFYTLSDLLLAEEGRDWNGQFLQVAQGYMEQVKAQVEGLRAARKVDSHPTLSLEQLTGAYENELFGEAVVSLENGQITLRYGQISAQLEAWEADTYLGRWNLKGLLDDVLIAFTPDSLTILNDRATYQRKKV